MCLTLDLYIYKKKHKIQVLKLVTKVILIVTALYIYRDKILLP